MSEGPKYKLDKLIRRVQHEEYPPGTETPNRLLSLWRATMNVWQPMAERYEEIDVTLPPTARRIFEADAEAFEARMRRYKAAIDDQIAAGEGDTVEGRNALLDTVINGGFLLNPMVEGKRKGGIHLPDFATPFAVANQYDAIAGFQKESVEMFWDDIRQGVLAVPHEVAERVSRAATHIVKGIATGAVAGLGLPLAVAGLVLGGIYIWKKGS